MGFTPLEGLVMGTRSGDIDPALPAIIARREDLSSDAVEALLNQSSGLLGLCGASDLRDVLRLAGGGDTAAKLAVDMFVHRIRKYVGAYSAVLGDVHALVFSGGIGQHHPWLWRDVCRDLSMLGIEIDADRTCVDEALPRDVASMGSRVRVLVIETDEESEIARQTVAAIKGS